MERDAPRQPQRVIRLRQRQRTLPVIVAMVGSLVWRRRPAGAEVQRGLAREGLLGGPPGRVRVPALITRLDVLPAAGRGQLCAAGCAPRQAQEPPALPHLRWAPGRDACSLIARGDGSPLAALRTKTQG